jgi:hypothetical protein
VPTSFPLASPDATGLQPIERVGGALAIAADAYDNQPHVSPDGARMAILGNGELTLLVYNLSEEAPDGRAVLTWRAATPRPQSEEPPWPEQMLLRLVGWVDDRTVSLIAGEPDPKGKVSGYGISFWLVDAVNGTAERRAWLQPPWYMQEQNVWLTDDGHECVLQYWNDQQRTIFAVCDLTGGTLRTLSADIPTYECGASSLYERAPNGRLVAWQTKNSWGSPVACEVRTLDLRTGNGQTIYTTGSEGAMAGISWAPDSEHLAVFVAKPGEPRFAFSFLDDWGEWIAPRCLVIALDGTVIANIAAPDDGLWPEIGWAEISDRMLLFSARKVTGQSGGQADYARHYRVYAADLTGALTLLAEPPVEGRDLYVTAAFTPDGGAVVNYMSEATGFECWASLFGADLARVATSTSGRALIRPYSDLVTLGGDLLYTYPTGGGLRLGSPAGRQLLDTDWRVHDILQPTDSDRLIGVAAWGAAEPHIKRLFFFRKSR